MQLIAHRGLTQGPDKNIENHPEQIAKAINQGFDCEIDLRIIGSKLMLGHDDAQYVINKNFLSDHSEKLWIHAKNLQALHWLTNEDDLNFFWHQEDDFVITSKKYIWTYPGKELTNKSIMVMPEWHDPSFENLNVNCFGICSDYVENIKRILD